MSSALPKFVLTFALLAVPMAASALGADTSISGASTQNDAMTTTSESDGGRGNERQGAAFPWGLLGLVGPARLAGRRVVEQWREIKLGRPTEGPRPS